MAAEIIDQANELVELTMEHALQRIRIDRNAVSAERCEACGVDIPEARRAAVSGCKTCVDCQQLNELRGSKHARYITPGNANRCRCFTR